MSHAGAQVTRGKLALLDCRFLPEDGDLRPDEGEIRLAFQQSSGLPRQFVAQNAPNVGQLARELSEEQRARERWRLFAHRLALLSLILLLALGLKGTDDLATAAAYSTRHPAYFLHHVAFFAFAIGWVEATCRFLRRKANPAAVATVGGGAGAGLLHLLLWLDLSGATRIAHLLYFSIGVNLFLAGAVAGIYVGLLLLLLFFVELWFSYRHPQLARGVIAVSLVRAIPLLSEIKGRSPSRDTKESLHNALARAGTALRKYLPRVIHASPHAVRENYTHRARTIGVELQIVAERALSDRPSVRGGTAKLCQQVLQAVVSEEWTDLPEVQAAKGRRWELGGWPVWLAAVALAMWAIEEVPRPYPRAVEIILGGMAASVLATWAIALRNR